MEIKKNTETNSHGNRLFVKLEELIVDEVNPRIIPATNEEEAILRIIEDQGNNLYNLASDIILNGLSPIESIAVFKIGDNKYKIKEGNRRITCMKILRFSEIHEIVKTHDEKLYNKFKNLIENNQSKIPNTIEVYVHPDENYLDYLMERRHLGEDEGRGISSWNAIQKDRYKKNKGEGTPVLSFLDTMVADGYLNSDDAYTNINLTNWTRILGSVGRKELNLSLHKKKFYILDKKNFEQKIPLVVEKLRNATVKIVYDKEAVVQFFNEINEELGTDKTKNQLQFETIITPEDNVLINNDGKNYTINNIERSDFLEIEPDKESNMQNNGKYNNTNDSNQRITVTRNVPTIENKYSTLKCTSISKEDYQILYLHREIRSISRTGDYKKYPLATVYLTRSLFEQSIKYWCHKIGKSEFTRNQQGEDLQLSKIIKNAIKIPSFFKNHDLDRLFQASFNSQNSTSGKELLDIFMHNPKYFSGNYQEIMHLINGIIFDVINYVLNN